MKHKIQCRCGALGGFVGPLCPANRCVCYCIDCQAFATHLGEADATLDVSGGTEIIQVPAGNVTFTHGIDKLACLRLSEKGMVRWYAACCMTPIGNTPADWRISFVGLIHSCLQAGDQSLDSVFGPVRMRGFVANAKGPSAPQASGLILGIAKLVVMIVRARLSGSYRRTPFFDANTGTPVAKPVVLTHAELQAAKRTD